MNTIYLWSNGHVYKDLEQYGKALDGFTQKSDSINVFLNTCVPVQANQQVFDGKHNISIHCGVGESSSPSGILGYEEMIKYHGLLNSSYVIDGGMYFWKIPNDITLLNEKYKQYLTVGEYVCLIDSSQYKDSIPKDSPWGITTGFRTYFLLNQLYQDSNIVLVNFGVKDTKYNIIKKFHCIDHEDKWFTDNQVQRITI